MAITQVGSTELGATTTTSLAIDKPTGVASGDILIAAITSNTTAQSAPSGWTNFDGQSNTFQVQLYWKLAGGSEPSSYTWTCGTDSGAGSGGLIQAWRGVHNTTPIDGTNDDIVATNVAEPYAGLSVTAASSAGKVFCIRGVRQTSAGGAAGTMSTSTSGASWHNTASGFSGTGNTLYSVGIFSITTEYTSSGSQSGCNSTWTHGAGNESHNYRATFALRAAGTPATGDWTSTLPAVTSSFAGEREPNSGSIDASTPSITSSMAGTHYVPATGAIDATVPLVQAEVEGHSDLAGQVDASLPLLSVALVGETVPPDSEHVIKVEADHRAFLVVDDGITDTGLKPIKRSRVTDA